MKGTSPSRSIPDWEFNWNTKYLMPGEFFHLLILFVIATKILLSTTIATAAGIDVVVRNDQFPLKVDFEIGRFGIGRLYLTTRSISQSTRIVMFISWMLVISGSR